MMSQPFEAQPPVQTGWSLGESLILLHHEVKQDNLKTGHIQEMEVMRPDHYCLCRRICCIPEIHDDGRIITCLILFICVVHIHLNPLAIL